MVAGFFAVLVSVLLLVDFAKRSANDPLDSARLLALRQQLRQQPANAELQQAARTLDLELRQQYFRQRDFTRRGVYLLIAASGVALVGWRWAAKVRRRLPQPPPGDPVDPQSRLARIGLPATAVMALLLVGATIGLSVTYRSPLPVSAEELAMQAPGQTAGEGQTASGTGQPPGDATESAASTAAATDQPLPPREEFLRNWPSFRGPRGNGISPYTNIPTSWDVESGEGILWKTALPLPGNSSPIVWNEYVFLTGATADRREVYGLDANTGELLWQTAVIGNSAPSPPEDEINEDTGYAAPTPATDGLRVYAIFLNGDLAAFDFTGKQLWFHSFGELDNVYGHSTSLVTYRDLVIVQLDHGGPKDGKARLYAVDGKTGEIVWEKPREVGSCWASPIVVRHEDQPRIIAPGDPWVVAYSPEDGQELWRVSRRGQDVASTPVYANGIVYIASEFPGLWAIQDGGQGDVTESHVQWMADFGAPDTSSPLVTDDLVLMAASYGTLSCYGIEGSDEPLWEEDFDGSFSSSPSLVGEQVYLFGLEGTGWVIRPGRESCERVSESSLGEECVTCPAFQDGRMFIRGAEHLFCIGS
jgi:outer membrane protein assembly factor BamB